MPAENKSTFGKLGRFISVFSSTAAALAERGVGPRCLSLFRGTARNVAVSGCRRNWNFHGPSRLLLKSSHASTNWSRDPFLSLTLSRGLCRAQGPPTLEFDHYAKARES